MSDGAIRFTVVLGILSAAAAVQQYFENNSEAVVGCLIVAGICLWITVSYYLRVSKIRKKP